MKRTVQGGFQYLIEVSVLQTTDCMPRKGGGGEGNSDIVHNTLLTTLFKQTHSTLFGSLEDGRGVADVKPLSKKVAPKGKVKELPPIPAGHNL